MNKALALYTSGGQQQIRRGMSLLMLTSEWRKEWYYLHHAKIELLVVINAKYLGLERKFGWENYAKEKQDLPLKATW